MIFIAADISEYRKHYTAILGGLLLCVFPFILLLHPDLISTGDDFPYYVERVSNFKSLKQILFDSSSEPPGFYLITFIFLWFAPISEELYLGLFRIVLVSFDYLAVFMITYKLTEDSEIALVASVLTLTPLISFVYIQSAFKQSFAYTLLLLLVMTSICEYPQRKIKRSVIQIVLAIFTLISHYIVALVLISGIFFYLLYWLIDLLSKSLKHAQSSYASSFVLLLAIISYYVYLFNFEMRIYPLFLDLFNFKPYWKVVEITDYYSRFIAAQPESLLDWLFLLGFLGIPWVALIFNIYATRAEIKQKGRMTISILVVALYFLPFGWVFSIMLTCPHLLCAIAFNSRNEQSVLNQSAWLSAIIMAIIFLSFAFFPLEYGIYRFLALAPFVVTILSLDSFIFLKKRISDNLFLILFVSLSINAFLILCSSLF
ncbi:MAG: hypothetical protein ACE5OZ_03140 [Candidatus Heimdallarchaeota archaeon]